MVKLSNGISPDRLDQLIKDLGVRVRVFRSTICPNITSLETLDHDINCTVCNNSMIDFCPQETIALFQQQDLTQQFKVQGTFHLDEIMVTFLAGQTLQHYTRVELLDFAEDFYELVQRQEGTLIDRLKYPACCVSGVFTVESGVKVQYHFGTDFEISVNGDIKWISPHLPADRKIYSVYYKHRPVFRAIKAVHRDRYSQYNLRPEEIAAPHTTIDGKTYVKLQETWILKRDYLLERRDQSGNKLSENTYYNPNEEPGD
jgi:hypothetical protein